jgi:hypothetical protein
VIRYPKLTHSCRPNCILVLDQEGDNQEFAVNVKSLTNISDQTPLTINYFQGVIHEWQLLNERDTMIQTRFWACTCAYCALEREFQTVFERLDNAFFHSDMTYAVWMAMVKETQNKLIAATGNLLLVYNTSVQKWNEAMKSKSPNGENELRDTVKQNLFYKDVLARNLRRFAFVSKKFKSTYSECLRLPAIKLCFVCRYSSI